MTSTNKEEEGMEHLLYTAIFQHSSEGVEILFPNEEIMTVQENTLEQALQSAREVLALAVLDAEEEGREFAPEPINVDDLLPDQKVVSIDVWIPLERAKIKETYQKKTLTIPAWLDLLGQRRGVNFSQLLTRALKKELGIQE